MRVSSITRTTFISALAGLAGLAALSTAAAADAVVKMDVDTTRLVKLSGTPATVVLSNPIYADATIQADRLILIGKNTGRTQVMVLDLDGNQLANFTVNVQRAEDQVVSVYRAGQRLSMHCAPFCDTVLNVNDEAGNFKVQSEQITLKGGLAANGGGGAGNGNAQ